MCSTEFSSCRVRLDAASKSLDRVICIHNVWGGSLISLDGDVSLWLLIGPSPVLRYRRPLGVSVATRFGQWRLHLSTLLYHRTLKLMHAPFPHLSTHLQDLWIDPNAAALSLLCTGLQFVANEEQEVMISRTLWVSVITVLTNASSPAVETCNVCPLTADLTRCRCFCSEVRMAARTHRLESSCSF